MDSGLCPSHNVLKGAKNNTLFLKLDLLPFSQEIWGGTYSVGLLRMGSSQHLDVHRVGISYVRVMNKGDYKLQALGNVNDLCALKKSCYG